MALSYKLFSFTWTGLPFTFFHLLSMDINTASLPDSPGFNLFILLAGYYNKSTVNGGSSALTSDTKGFNICARLLFKRGGCLYTPVYGEVIVWSVLAVAVQVDSLKSVCVYVEGMRYSLREGGRKCFI